MEAIVLEFLPVVAVLLLAGATGAKIGESTSLQRGAITGAAVAGIGVLLRTVVVSYGFFDDVQPPNIAVIFLAAVTIGSLSGAAGGFLAKKFA